MRRKKGRLPPFVPLLKDTVKTAAWKALSHGARSLYVALKGRYNNKLQNALYVSTRDAEEVLRGAAVTDTVSGPPLLNADARCDGHRCDACRDQELDGGLRSPELRRAAAP